MNDGERILRVCLLNALELRDRLVVFEVVEIIERDFHLGIICGAITRDCGCRSGGVQWFSACQKASYQEATE
jgi:hypothetical protein